MFRQMLMAGASRMVRQPENDDGHSDADPQDLRLDDDDIDDDADLGDGDYEDDQSGDDDAGDDELEGDPAPAAPASRGANRIATLAAERAAATARADAAERELATIRQERQQHQQRETAEQEAQRLAMMDPEERAEYRINQVRAETRQTLDEIRFTAADTADKTSFDAICARNPAVAKMKDEVEDALKAMRAQGTTAPRETVAAYLIGQKALAKQPRAAALGARKAAEGRERQQGRPAGGRGDVPPTGARRGGSEAEQRRRRLEDMEI